MKTLIIRPHQLILRDLFCLVLVAVAGVAFWREHQKVAQHAAQLAADLDGAQMKQLRLQAELQATRQELAEAKSEFAALESPILKRAEELKDIAFKSDHGQLGCGDGGPIRFIDDHGRSFSVKCGLDAIHVFGDQVEIADMLALLHARIKSNKSGKRGPMSSGAGSLCHVICETFSVIKQRAAVPVMKDLVVTEKNPLIQADAAHYLWEMGQDEALRDEIHRIKFPSGLRYYGPAPDWVVFQEPRPGNGAAE